MLDVIRGFLGYAMVVWWMDTTVSEDRAASIFMV
jgi:hypothetical protein